MILKLLTREDGPEMRDAKDLVSRVSDEGYETEVINYDDVEADQIKELYDIYSTPAFIITEDDGKLVEIWQGEIPTENEIKNLLRL
jgi:thioredoxin-related protein